MGDLNWAEFPEGYTFLEAVASVKVLDPEGDVALITCSTMGLSAWEAIGMCVLMQRDMESAMYGVEEDDTD